MKIDKEDGLLKRLKLFEEKMKKKLKENKDKEKDKDKEKKMRLIFLKY